MKNCEIHGDYEDKSIMCLGIQIEFGCPICKQQELEESEQLRIKEKEYEEIARKRFWAERANIPIMYRTLSKFNPLDAQKNVLYNFDKNLVIVGGVGTGKTMYACWLGLKAIEAFKTVRYIYASDLSQKVKATWGSKVTSESEVIEEYVECDFLILDEIGRTEYNEYLFKVLDGRYLNGKHTAILGNIEPKELTVILGEAIASRLRTNVKLLSFGTVDCRGKF